ncbi:N-acetylneuraminate synthase family protein [Dyadobacter sp. CY323]|uniref:N-acetylneuraminate synthase family protein n=1 Tax=Dyadobacter sp. CY323 TaxID=2907302 RepID=UPI001F3E21F7|nr:N-acetylneuraminate synthase family protein [Dyadobacter sp. CY323]MCE6988667.1 N-acetylneuraminate synthase family protein [Dyadobacter sp. CY323]
MDNIYIIGEVGQAHEGSIALAHSYIAALATTGVDAVKFQMHIAEAESSIHEPFRQTLPYQEKTRFDYWKRMEFSKQQWLELKQHCESRKLDFIVSPCSIAAVNILEEIGMLTFKIGSGEVGNILMLNRIARSAKNVILSSGMSSLTELDQAVDILKTGKSDISILQCTSAYPSRPHQWGINLIAEWTDRYQLPVGFSDHSGDIFAALAAATAGAKLIEFHVVFDKRIAGPDSSSSLTVDQAITLVTGIRQIEIALKNPVTKTDNEHTERLKCIFGKSLAVNKSLTKGHILTESDLESKKPKGYGIAPSQYERILGKPLRNDLEQWDFLTESHI